MVSRQGHANVLLAVSTMRCCVGTFRGATDATPANRDAAVHHQNAAGEEFHPIAEKVGDEVRDVAVDAEAIETVACSHSAMSRLLSGHLFRRSP